MDVVIRQLQEEDREVFEKLYTATVMEEFPEYSKATREYFTSGKYLESMWELPIKFGVFLENTLIGYILSGNPFGGVVFLHWLVLERKYHKKGIGTKSLLHFENFIKGKGAHNIHLLADKKNVPFYEKLGYEVYGFDDNGYYGCKDYWIRKIIQEPQENTFYQ